MRPIAKILGVGLAAASLGACAGKADLGRSKPNELSFLNDIGQQVDALVGPEDPAQGLPMTAAEAQLRTIADTIDEQTAVPDIGLLERLVLDEMPDNSDGKAYYRALRKAHEESGISLLNAFGNDVLRDIAMVDQFANLSVAVTDADAERLALVRNAMTANRATFSDAVDVILRVEDNGKVIDHVADLMNQRFVEYEVALEQAAFDVPGADTVATIGKALLMLKTSVAGIKGDAIRHRAVRGELFGRRSTDLPV